ncbi:hypothetical protein Ate02nite_53770 [Paractinoplanes tereljensis]|uniref:Uncharacterized protein n=2 Tax=Paractinoplanes tereljensis TaxID=571912 RepID=A0A919NS96_9ACTN|nr:hypothetical protein Ate02nite_53770 [Actinoplanes tereljensis]
MFGLMIGAVAVAWGVVIAMLDQPGAFSGRHLNRLCTALLIGCAVVTVTGGVAAATIYR